MKKAFVFLMTLVLLIGGGIYVHRQLPKWMIQGGIVYLEKTNYEMILDSPKVSLDSDQKLIAKEMLESATFDVVDSTIEKDQAMVMVNVTLIDLMQLIKDERETIFKNTMTDWRQTLNDLFNQQLEGLAIRQLARILEESEVKPMMTMTVEVPFVRSYLWWKPVITKEWIQSVIEEYLTQA